MRSNIIKKLTAYFEIFQPFSSTAWTISKFYSFGIIPQLSKVFRLKSVMASDKEDMSLEDIIKENRISGNKGGGCGRGGFRGGRGRGFSQNNDGQRRGTPRGGLQQDCRPMPYVRVQVPDVWEHDLYERDSRTRGGAAQRALAPKVTPRPRSDGTVLNTTDHES